MKLTTNPFLKLAKMTKVHERQRPVYDVYRLLCKPTFYTVTNGSREEIAQVCDMLQKKQFRALLRSSVAPICMQAVTFLLSTLFASTLLRRQSTTKGLALLTYKQLKGNYYLYVTSSNTKWISIFFTFLPLYVQDERFLALLCVCLQRPSKTLKRLCFELVHGYVEQWLEGQAAFVSTVRYQTEWVIVLQGTIQEAKQLETEMMQLLPLMKSKITTYKPSFLHARFDPKENAFRPTFSLLESFAKQYHYGSLRPFCPKARMYFLKEEEAFILFCYQKEYEKMKKELSYMTKRIPKHVESLWYYSFLKTITQKKRSTLQETKRAWPRSVVVPKPKRRLRFY